MFHWAQGLHGANVLMNHVIYDEYLRNLNIQKQRYMQKLRTIFQNSLKVITNSVKEY